jgi:hypothetical protein
MSNSKIKRTFAITALLTLTVGALSFLGHNAASDVGAATSNQEAITKTANDVVIPRVFHRTVKIDGLDIFYREAGPKNAPHVLLLHGFPTSSHMFHNLIPTLADKYHVIAPDYPGYGNSSMPTVDEFVYTFDRKTLARLSYLVDRQRSHDSLGRVDVRRRDATATEARGCPDSPFAHPRRADGARFTDEAFHIARAMWIENRGTLIEL